MTAELTKSKTTSLFLVLSGIFLTNAITAEIIGVKIFSLEESLGMSPARISLWDNYTFDFNLTAGAIIWPFVFITTDIINEYFGKAGVKKISYLTVCLITYVFIILWLATYLVPANFWVEINKVDIEGKPFNINSAYATLFRQGGGIIIGSLTAFLIGQLLDVYVFHFIKEKTGNKAIWLRSTGSTLISQLIDSFIVLFIAFYIFAGERRWDLSMVFAVGTINYIYKMTVAILLTPLLYLAHKIIDNYLGQELSSSLIEKASEKK